MLSFSDSVRALISPRICSALLFSFALFSSRVILRLFQTTPLLPTVQLTPKAGLFAFYPNYKQIKGLSSPFSSHLRHKRCKLRFCHCTLFRRHVHNKLCHILRQFFHIFFKFFYLCLLVLLGIALVQLLAFHVCFPI